MIAPDQREASLVTLRKLSVVVLMMFGFGYAMVPFYEQICKATGIRNLLQPDRPKNTRVDLGRSVRIEFDANVRKLPWRFYPLEAVRNVHPGEVVTVLYEIENPTDRVVVGQAVPSYGPKAAEKHFSKLDCFCFTQQTLQPREKRQMQVVFVIDPELPAELNAITLSYTFFEIEGATRS